MSRRTLFLGSVAFAGGMTFVWLASTSAVAQLGGQGIPGGSFRSEDVQVAQFGGGDFGGLFQPPQSLAGEQMIQGGSMEVDGPSSVILIAPDKIRAWGYSTAKGEWKQAPLDDKAETAVVPIVGQLVAVVAEGRKVHGFSNFKGEWATLELPEGTKPEPVVLIDAAYVKTPTSLSIFSARTGNWATVKFTEK